MDEKPFRAAIRADPRDDAPLLIYADWIEEQGGADRAAALRRFVAEGWPREVAGLDRLFTYLDEPLPFGPDLFERWDNGLTLMLCWCPPGSYAMGSSREDSSRQEDEARVRVVLTAGFWLGKSPVTQSEWERLMETSLRRQGDLAEDEANGQGADYPMYFVNHDEAVEFARRLTQAERLAGRLPAGRAYRLPTEAQWEYACRAGTTGRFSFDGRCERLEDYGWFQGNSGYMTHRVGWKHANRWGLHDMHGNVEEWCADWYTQKLVGGTNPTGPNRGMERVQRGGSWASAADSARSASRASRPPEARSEDAGFRVALVPAD